MENNFLKENEATYVLKNICYFDGISNFIKSNVCNIFMQEDRLKIVDLANKNIAYVKYSQIIAGDIFNDKQIQEQSIIKNGSIVGRGIMGGWLFGPAGLLLGGLSGVGAKNKSVIHEINNYYIIINYISENTKNKEVISFNSNILTQEMKEFINKLQSKIEKKEINL